MYIPAHRVWGAVQTPGTSIPLSQWPYSSSLKPGYRLPPSGIPHNPGLARCNRADPLALCSSLTSWQRTSRWLVPDLLQGVRLGRDIHSYHSLLKLEMGIDWTIQLSLYTNQSIRSNWEGMWAGAVKEERLTIQNKFKEQRGIPCLPYSSYQAGTTVGGGEREDL